MKKLEILFDHDYWEAAIDFSVEGESRFKRNPFSGVCCTGYAFEVVRRLGHRRVKVVGYFTDNNPSATAGAEAGGHDFAIVDRRWIVDAWLREVDGYGNEQIVYHLQRDRALIRKLYGDPKKWVAHHSKRTRELINGYV
jgi:hypothetical protein